MSPRSGAAALAVLLAAPLAGCPSANMDKQPKRKPLSPSAFFPDGRSARPLPPGVEPLGPLRSEAFETGLEGGKPLDGFTQPPTPAAAALGLEGAQPVDVLPVPLTPALLARGKERFDIYCAVCHGPLGDGDGMVPRRGFPRPPSYHLARLRGAPLGHFVDVMRRGFGTMYAYGDRVDAADRWAVAAYIRALQLSQHARLEDVPRDQRARLEDGPR